jgi:hypothetical protein
VVVVAASAAVGVVAARIDEDEVNDLLVVLVLVLNGENPSACSKAVAVKTMVVAVTTRP